MTNSTAIEGRRRRASISTWGRGLPPAKIRYNGRRVFKGWATYPYPQAVLGPATNLVPGSPCVIVIPTRICSLRGLQTFAASHTPWTKAQNRARYRFDAAVCNCCCCGAHTGCPTAGRSFLLKQTHAPDLGRYNDMTAFVPLALLNAKGCRNSMYVRNSSVPSCVAHQRTRVRRSQAMYLVERARERELHKGDVEETAPRSRDFPE